MRTSALLFMLLLGNLSAAPAQSDADRDAIKQAALDYAESYYEGNPEKMERALHPDLAKRIANKDQRGNSRVDHMSAMTLVQIIRRGSGKSVPKEENIKEVIILDALENSASVKLIMRDWVDYMHLGKVNGKWVIINVLWEMKAKKSDAPTPTKPAGNTK